SSNSPFARPKGRSLPDAETLDERRIAIRVLALQIVEQPPPLANQLQQAATGMVILRVNLEVFCQVVDTLAEECHLHFRRSRIAVVCLVVPDNSGLAVLG